MLYHIEHIPRHVIDYSKASMLSLLKDSGFEPHRIKHFNLRDNAPALASSMFPSLDPVSRSVRQHKHGVREGALVARYPLLIQKTLADKLSDKVQVIIAPLPAAGKFIGSSLIGDQSSVNPVDESFGPVHWIQSKPSIYFVWVEA